MSYIVFSNWNPYLDVHMTRDIIMSLYTTIITCSSYLVLMTTYCLNKVVDPLFRQIYNYSYLAE